MKKIIFIIVGLLLLCGCDNVNNTPTKQVESFFNKYQTLDTEVLNDLDRVISEDMNFDTSTRDKYRDVIKDQYRNLTYEIKDEYMDGDEATVTATITVIDYRKVLNEAKNYRDTHNSEFLGDNGTYSSVKYSNYVIEQLKKSKDKIDYTVELKLTKIDDKWKINNINEETEDKILGIYEY